MRGHRDQKGSVLIVSLVILLVMTLLGVSAMTDSGLQERMVGNQKQAIEASMAAESGAVTAVQWLRAHPESWGKAPAWKSNKELPAEPPRTSNFGDGPVYWIESIRFNGNTAIIVSRGGVLVADKVVGQSAVMVILQSEIDETNSAINMNRLAGNGENNNDNVRKQKSGLSAAVSSSVKLFSVDIQYAEMGVKTDYGSTDDSTDLVARLDDLPRIREIRNKIIGWRTLAAVGAQGSDSE